MEAGEKLGFLPGDLQQKVDPYLRPLYDALFDMLGADNFQKYQERGNIEVAPLAYMRGRTLDDSFIAILETSASFPVRTRPRIYRTFCSSISSPLYASLRCEEMIARMVDAGIFKDDVNGND